MNKQEAIRQRFFCLKDQMNERVQRIFAASEARAYGYGGFRAVSKATGIAISTIHRGLKDIDNPNSLQGTIRRPGAGRPSITKTSPTLLEDLRTLVEPVTMGDPMRLLFWVSKSHSKLTAALREMGHKISASTVAILLVKLGFCRQVNRKTREGTSNPDRDQQFEHIDSIAKVFTAEDEPVISMDTKKKELIGDFKNNGSDYRPSRTPDLVRTHDFIDEELGKAIPHGIYDIGANSGWVTLGINKDTCEFAVNSLLLWWSKVGRERYPNATRLMITADGGGSNSSRAGLWKTELQKLATELGIAITVCHYPPGTSKWNKIEHRMFCHITQNWRGRPLTSCLTLIELISATTTKTGLTVRCELDDRTYETGIKVSKDELKRVNKFCSPFHPEWNYTIYPSGCEIDKKRALIYV